MKLTDPNAFNLEIPKGVSPEALQSLLEKALESPVELSSDKKLSFDIAGHQVQEVKTIMKELEKNIDQPPLPF